MRYWVLDKDRVVGPYPPEELARLPNFGAESEVCPEAKRGNRTEDWAQAQTCADLAMLLERPERPARRAQPMGETESILQEFVRHGSLVDKVTLLENAIARLKEQLAERDRDILDMRRQNAERALDAAKSKEKANLMEADAAQAGDFRERLERALSDKRAAESSADMQQLLITELKDKIAALQQGESLTKKVDELGKTSAHFQEDIAKSASELASLREAIGHETALTAELKERTDALAVEKTRSAARHGLVESLSAEVERLKSEVDRLRGAHRPPVPPRAG